MFRMRGWLIEKRKSRGLTQAEMAVLLKIPETTYQAYERGTRTPRISRAKVLAKRLGVSWLLFVDESEFQELSLGMTHY